MLSAVRGVVRAAFPDGAISAADYLRLKMVKGVEAHRQPSGRSLDAGEAAALFRACTAERTPSGTRDAATFALMYGAGLRRAEAAALDLADYNRETGALRVIGKGDKERTAYVGKGGMDALADWLEMRGDDPGPFLVPVDHVGRLTVRRMTPQALMYRLRRRTAQAGIAPCSPHDLRRSFVSSLLDAGLEAPGRVPNTRRPRQHRVDPRNREPAPRSPGRHLSAGRYRSRPQQIHPRAPLRPAHRRPDFRYLVRHVHHAGTLRGLPLRWRHLGPLASPPGARRKARPRAHRARRERWPRALTYRLKFRGEDPDPLLVPVSKSGTITVRGMSTQTVMFQLRRRSVSRRGVRWCSSHDLRRSFVNALLDRGVDLGTVQDLAGQADPKTTRLYDCRGDVVRRQGAAELHVPVSGSALNGRDRSNSHKPAPQPARGDS